MFQAVNPLRKSDTPCGAILYIYTISIMSEMQMIYKFLLSLCVTHFLHCKAVRFNSDLSPDILW